MNKVGLNNETKLDSISSRVKNFYEDHPFPGYDVSKYGSREDLYEKGSWYFKLLDQHIPVQDVRLVDVGCGTGQITCFLGLKEDRQVLGVDLSDNSLKKASDLKEKLHLTNVTFKKESVLELGLPSDTFDYVFCNGVLHHTPDPYGGFKNLVRICKPGGFLIIGLYNTFGRLFLNIRRPVVNFFFRNNRRIKDHFIKKQLVELEDDWEKRTTWYADQYLHPHESCHTVDEVLMWFSKNGISYVNSMPPVETFRKLSQTHSFLFQENIFHKQRKTGRLSHLITQMKWIFTLNGGGGYFVMIGQKDAT